MTGEEGRPLSAATGDEIGLFFVGPPMRTREQDVEPFVNLSELTEIELLIMRRMREFTIGEHRSLFHGTGFDYVGLRDWQAGDRMSQIDWPQSTLTNFSPMVVRDYEQRSTATVVAIADASLSTRCGIDGVPIAAAIARTIGTIGMSAVFFQDLFGLITFGANFDELSAIRPRVGKNQVIHCLDAYQFGEGLLPLRRADSLSMTLAGFMRKTSMVPVISDFLFDEAGTRDGRARPDEQSPRRLHRADRQRLRLRAAAGVGRLDRGVRRRDRQVASDVARRAADAFARVRERGRTMSRGWRRRATSTCCGSASTSCRRRSR